MNIVAALRTTRAGAVEMPPRGKRGKLPERVSHSFHRAWKSGKERPDSHISTAPAAGLFMTKEMKNDGDKTEFQLTDSITSSTIGTPASLRSENDQLHLGTSDWDPIGITNHLHRNKHELVTIVFSALQDGLCGVFHYLSSHPTASR
jgi:hypothetical protein